MATPRKPKRILPVSPLVSAHAYAKSKGVDAKVMRATLKRVGLAGRFDPDVADKLIADAQAARYQNENPANKESYAEGDRRQKWAKARQEELKLQKIEGALVLRSQVQAEVFDMIRRMRDRLVNIPSRVSGVLAAESDQARIYAYLTQEIQQACEDLSA